MANLADIEKGIRDRLVEHEALVDSLLEEREQIRGSLFSRFAVCGKPSCACAQGQKHGPYYVLSNRSAGQGAFVYLKDEQVGRVKELVTRHKRFKTGLRRLKGVSLRLRGLLERYEVRAAQAGSRQAGVKGYNTDV